ncbi:MAG: MotA/TolQ/ExbB proton channel family protein [Pseudomonadota bacterium]
MSADETDTAQTAGEMAAEAIADPSWVTQVQSLLEIGGPVVTALVLMSFAAMTIVIVKVLQFAWLRIGNTKAGDEALRLWRSNDAASAIARLDGQKAPTAVAMALAITAQTQGVSETAIREEVVRYGNNVLFHLRRGFRPLEVIGSLAPLLGLLGTVMGMIRAFQQLEAAGNQVNPAILSGGIWEALLTTAVGLIVAIPVVASLNWLERRVDHLAHHMDNLVSGIFTKELAVIADANTSSKA